MNVASLLVIQGQDQGARLKLREGSVGIGRGVRNELRLLDTEVSRQHAQILFQNEKYVLHDRGSSNGTFVNGNVIRQIALRDGDRVQIGRTVILFSGSTGEESRHAATLIDLVGRAGLHDSSRIVGRVANDGERPETVFSRPAETSVLSQIAEEAVKGSGLEQTLDRILDLTIAALGADRGGVLLGATDTDELTPIAARHRRGATGGRIPVSRSIIDYALRTGQGVRTSDARHDNRFEAGKSILQAGVREALCVPMQARNSPVGVIYIDTTSPAESWMTSRVLPGAFGDEHLRLLVAIARQTALAVENARYQQALVKAERLAAMGQTIALLSHHIKNILQGVRGGSYLIDMGLGGHDEDLVRRGWAIVEKNQGKIYHLVMDMLTFSKERQPTLAAGRVEELVNEIGELMHTRAAECGVDLTWRNGTALPESTFDPEGIHRAVLNVVINAIDAVEGSDGGKVTLESAYMPENDLVAVVVTDNGPGIPADKMSTIFNIFESTKGARGTGLGLAVSRKILREHGGEITVETEPGQGCRFVLSWPRHPDEDQRGVDFNTKA